MVEWTPIKCMCLSDPFPPPTDTTTLLVARYLLIKTLVARQLLTNVCTELHYIQQACSTIFSLESYCIYVPTVTMHDSSGFKLTI